MNFRKIFKDHQHLISVIFDFIQIVNIFLDVDFISIFVIIAKGIFNLIKEKGGND